MCGINFSHATDQKLAWRHDNFKRSHESCNAILSEKMFDHEFQRGLTANPCVRYFRRKDREAKIERFKPQN